MCPFEVRGLVTFTLRCALIMTFYHKHNGLHDTHFDRGAKKRDSMRSLANLSRPGRVVTNIFKFTRYFRRLCLRFVAKFVMSA